MVRDFIKSRLFLVSVAAFVLLVLTVWLAVGLTAVADDSVQDTYYGYWSSDQIHRTWIDMDDDGVKDPYENTALSTEKRVEDLVSSLSLEEKCDQLNEDAPEIDRLGIPSYSWWLEALHGLTGGGWKMPGVATVFPQNVNQAMSFDKDLIREVFGAVAEEARAKYHKEGSPGLNFYSPAVVGIMQDKRWQRAEESFGESVYLTSSLAIDTFRAFQGDDDNVPYKRAVATAKHYVSNRGPFGRDHAYATKEGPASERKTWEVTLPPYKAAIQRGNVREIMTCYSKRRATGLTPSRVPLSYSEKYVNWILREKWGFTGHVTSDCWAIEGSMNQFRAPPLTRTRPGAAATALKAGVDLNCGRVYGSGAIVDAVEQGLISENVVTQAAERLFKSRFNLGLFDAPSLVPYADVSENVVACEEHVNLALKSAQESIVLLKNLDILPLDEHIDSLGVIGPVADDVHYGSYSGGGYHQDGGAPFSFTPIEGINSHVSKETEVNRAFTTSPKTVAKVAKNSEVAIVFVGPTPGVESNTQENLQQPFEHLKMLKAAAETGTPTVAVIVGGNPFASNFLKKKVDAVVQAGCLGMMQGEAIADVIFGVYNPGGSLSWTIPRPGNPTVYFYPKPGEFGYNENTYLWPFGHGLSYTEFEYNNLRVSPESISPSENVHISVDVRNIGEKRGDEVVQLYLRDLKASVKTPVKELKGFERASLEPGEEKTIEFTVPTYQLSLLDENLNRVVESGIFNVLIGKSSGNIILKDNFEVNKSMEMENSTYRRTETKVGNVVDTTPPAFFELTSPSNKASISENTPTFKWTSSSDNDSGIHHYEVWVDGLNVENVSAGTMSYDSQELSKGSHTWWITAVDEAGNERRAQEFSFEVKKSVESPEFEVTNLSLGKSEVECGESMKIYIKVKNTGGKSGSYTVELQIDGETKTEDVTLAPGHSKELEMKLFENEEGTYEVSIGDLTEIFEVTNPKEKESKGGGRLLLFSIVIGILVIITIIGVLVYRRE